GREVGRHRPPHAPVVHDIPDRVYHGAAAVGFRAATGPGLPGRDRQQRRDQCPLDITGIGRVVTRPAATRAGACAHQRGRANWHQGSWFGGLVSSPPSLPGAPPAFHPPRHPHITNRPPPPPPGLETGTKDPRYGPGGTACLSPRIGSLAQG